MAIVCIYRWTVRRLTNKIYTQKYSKKKDKERERASWKRKENVTKAPNRALSIQKGHLT